MYICSEEEELVDREVCQFSQEEGRQEVRGRECSSQQVTVCQPAQYGYPAGPRGSLCREAGDLWCLESVPARRADLSGRPRQPQQTVLQGAGVWSDSPTSVIDPLSRISC